MTTLTWILLGIDGVVLISLVLIALLIRYFLYAFLALHQPIDNADILVVEGWLEEHNLSATMAEFDQGGYQYLVTVGGAIRVGFRISGYETLAELTASTLLSLGFSPEKLVALPSPKTSVNRTETTAIVFHDWLLKNKLNIQAINLYSNHVHARRTHFLYQKYLSPEIKVGVIASRPVDYDPDNWWQSSNGTKVLILELIAYSHTIISSLIRSLKSVQRDRPIG